MGLHVGLDIGIASVGWCVIDPEVERIVAAGVRVFEEAENRKNGASLALPRRLARSARRRLRRRRLRMQRLRQLIVEHGVVSAAELQAVFVPQNGSKNPYELRVDGLDRRLTAEEWARVLSQLCKRRGYSSMRLSENEEGEDGAVKAAIAENNAIMTEKGYRTAGEMLWCDERFGESKRNKGDYKSVLSRGLLLDEIRILFEAQRTSGNPFASEELERAYVELINWQAPIAEGEALREKAWKCSIDRVNARIPAACPTFERFRLLDKLCNVRYTLAGDGRRHQLTPEQRQAIAEKAFSQKTPLALSHVRNECGLADDARFVGVRYSRNDPNDVSAEKKEKLPHPRRWHQMRECVHSVSPDAWASLSADQDLADAVASVLTYYKHEDSVRRELAALSLGDEIVNALGGLRFSKNGHLSRETLLKILPHMEAGLPYVEACAAAGLHHSARAGGERHDKLPPIPPEEVRNPVVLRALSQSRKVLNAIIDTFGPIEELHVELARDVAKSADERGKIERTQKENKSKNDAVTNQLLEEYGIAGPRPLDFVKYKLWMEQGGHCLYSGEYIDPQRMLSGEAGVAEVDHILPHSRSFDDGYMNKALVTTAENRNKGRRTPFEYFGGDLRRWHGFEARVHSMHLPRAKQERLLRRDFDERASDEFRERNLTDTQYIARYLKNFVEQNLRFSGDKKRPVLTINGKATAYLRTGWRLQKIRGDGDLHHALDATVIAAATRSMVQKVSDFYSDRPTRRSNGGDFYDERTGEVIEPKQVPEPWSGFREQVEAMMTARFSSDPLVDMADQSIQPKPILVSRMPNRTVRGEIHKETVKRIEGESATGHIITSKRVRLQDLTLKTLERMVGRERDSELYQALRRRLEEYGDDGAKAFAEPFHKPARPGRSAPLVRSIRVQDDPSSGGTRVRGGFADNGKMVRTDVFEKDGKYYLVPIYLKDVAAGELPNRAIVHGKPERDWRVMDETYRFAFGLYMNDVVRLTKKKGTGSETLLGYFKGTSRSTASIKIEAHDRSWVRQSLGVAQGVLNFDKLVVDVLGRSVHPVRRETRLGFPDGGNRTRS